MITSKISVLVMTLALIVFVLPLAAQEKLAPKQELAPVYEEEVRPDDPQVAGKRVPPPPPAALVKLSEDDEQKIIEFSRTIDPAIEVKLVRLREENPSRYDWRIQNLYREYVFLNRIKEEEPERYQEAIDLRKLSAQADELAEKYKNSRNESEKESLRGDLKQTLTKLFDLREKERYAEIERIKGRVDKLQGEMKERRKNKDQIIGNHLKKLIDEDHLYEW